MTPKEKRTAVLFFFRRHEVGVSGGAGRMR
jgi:hypothetical protein